MPGQRPPARLSLSEVDKPVKKSYRVVREWSVARADYTYAVYETTHWEDDKDTVTRREAPNAYPAACEDWAKRNAKHFRVKIEDDDA